MRRQQKGIDGNSSEKEIDCEAGLLKLFLFVGYRNRSVEGEIDVVVGLDEDGAMQHECREKDGSMKMLLGYLNSHNNFSFFKKKKNYIFFSFFINK
jgi:hypothetical protein